MKTLLELDPNDCRFPFGTENFEFCGGPKYLYLREGKLCQSSYCKEHHLICVVEPKPHKPKYVRRHAA